MRSDCGLATLAGWDRDDLAVALATFAATAGRAVPAAGGQARAFFEARFQPGTPRPALLTGYHEPELAGSRVPDARFCHPLYRAPAGLEPDAGPWHSRAEIAAGDLLAGNELVWLASPVEAFLAQVQGSVRIRFADGTDLRLGHGGLNRHPYRSIGQELVRQGAIAADAISADAIRDWCAKNPGRVLALLDHNPSFAFFRILDLPPDSGPLGSAGIGLTPWRSLATDPAHLPLGTPVWIEGADAAGRGRLMIAQDTGSAIQGPDRADIFCGSGNDAGRIAGAIRSRGRLTPLWPRNLGQG